MRSQRHYLAIALTMAVTAAAAFFSLSLRASDTPDVVKLGKGQASVESLPASWFGRHIMPPSPTPSERNIRGGEASFYGKGYGFSGRRTANGEGFNPQTLTAAHRTLPMGSRVRVTNSSTGQSTVVRINDRGPFHGNRVIDLSYAAAREIGLIRSGLGTVRLALLS